jgi:REP element-mobilizing transposase RayT
MDEPGSWHHIVNRGVAKRPLFETRADIRLFLAWLARQVRLKRMEIHAYCLMTTHFHLLVRSPAGQLSEAMRRAQSEHSRRFNRLHKRDGPLVRGRFFSRRVDSDEYRRAVVCYIDANPVKAGIVDAAGEYEFGSAAAYRKLKGPPWLTRSWVEDMACTGSSTANFNWASYLSVFGGVSGADLAAVTELVEARMTARIRSQSREQLLEAIPAHVQQWMKWKIRLADGMDIGLPICTPGTLRRALEGDREQRGAWMVEDGRRTWRGMEIARFGLLHELCRRSWQEVAKLESVSAARAHRLGQVHRRLLREQPDYAARVLGLSRKAVALTRPAPDQPR